MSKRSASPLISLRGVRQNNLKNFDLDLPTGRLIVVTGLSGSGKSSLAFDTLYAEGQRRYIETFSPYARQFFDRMDKPQVDRIQGIPPAIAIEQRNSVKSTRSTVGTMTEVCDYMKVVWAHCAHLYCRGCGKRVRKDSPQQIWSELSGAPSGSEGVPAEVAVTFELALSEKLSLKESLDLVAKQGYQRILLDQSDSSGRGLEFVRVEDASLRIPASGAQKLTVVQDRLRLEDRHRSRFIEACEQAYHFGKGKLAIAFLDGTRVCRFSKGFHCAACDLEYREPTPALFSFNHPVGACPACRGFGRIINIDYNLAIPDRTRSLAGGLVKPWQSGVSAECQEDLLKFCRIRNVPMDVPFERLAAKWQKWVVEGDPDYGKDADHEWPRAWYGIKGYFRWLESKAYKMHVRVLLSRYRSYQPCPDCQGRRFQPDALLFKWGADPAHLLTLADFYQLPVREALRLVEGLAAQHASPSDPLKLVLGEASSRLRYLVEVGLGYLTLDRPTRSLSGGETERVNLTSCLGSRLVNTLFVLDEPSVGLHARDTQRLIGILEQLRAAGNTVLVVEHEPAVMRAADQIVDLGPGHGEAGGSLVFQGGYDEILESAMSLTGQYLSGKKRIEIPPRRAVRQAPNEPFVCPTLTIEHARRHNLRDLTARIPLSRFVCITGVSGSGKTTLVREVLLPLLQAKLQTAPGGQPDSDEDTSDADAPEPTEANETTRVLGAEHVGRVVLVDQSLLGRTPRSNPAVYIGAFEQIREFFAASEVARQRGLNASAFSFNSTQGQCEQCRGAGFEKIEMQFLSDVFIRCPACQGKRFRQHILEVKVAPPAPASRSAEGRGGLSAKSRAAAPTAWSIADLLEATVDEAVIFLGRFADSRPAARAARQLLLLQEVGLGYLRLGQPINTLSGGESQRLKLVSHLAEFAAAEAGEPKPTLFLFDEPTTGLHFEDVAVLLKVFQRLVDQGHSLIVIEHNLELIKCADWVIDLGPEAGERGGCLVAEGTPEEIAAARASFTGESLREVLASLKPRTRP
jgi:excinuclease ABC subunit A